MNEKHTEVLLAVRKLPGCTCTWGIGTKPVGMGTQGGIASIHICDIYSEAAANRLVACWNGCLGINPEAVPELLEALEGVTNTATAIARTQRAGFEVRACAWSDLDMAANEARAAIAKAREVTP